MLQINGLKVVRGSFTVSLPVLNVADGQCVALCGVSGSGKSTLMEAIALLTPALEVNSFIIDGVAVDELVQKQQQAVRISSIGIMPQTGGLIPYLSIRENLELQIRMALRQQVKPVFEHMDATQDEYHHTAAIDSAAATAISNEGQTSLTLASYSEDLTQAASLHKAKEKQSLQANPQVSMAAKQMATAVDSIDAQSAPQFIPRSKSNASAEELIQAEMIDEQQVARSVTISNLESHAEVHNRLQILNPYIARMGLEHHLDKLPEQLSIGQRQRALFLRAIAHKPRLLLMDEPTSSLDPDNAAELFTIIEEIAQTSGMSVLLITHDLKAAARYKRYAYDSVRSHCDYSVFTFYDDSSRFEAEDNSFYTGSALDYPSAPHTFSTTYSATHESVVHMSPSHSPSFATADPHALLAHAMAGGHWQNQHAAGHSSLSDGANGSSLSKIGGFDAALRSESCINEPKGPYAHSSDFIYDHTGHLYSDQKRIIYYTTPPYKISDDGVESSGTVIYTSSKRGALATPNGGIAPHASAATAPHASAATADAAAPSAAVAHNVALGANGVAQGTVAGARGVSNQQGQE